MIEGVEELIGEIHSKFVRNELETILSRLVLIGVQPEEAIIIVAKTFDLAYAEGYSQWED